MEYICIVVPFEGAEKYTPIWAFEESGIDFRKEVEKAARCTSAFAAVELKKYLLRTLSSVHISFSSTPPSHDFFIELQLMDKKSKNEQFYLEPCKSGVIIKGEGRTGLLYGAYEFLRLQGWRWHEPGRAGEIVPGFAENLVLPEEKQSFKPSMNEGRGFDFEYASMESEELLTWMARNRLNVSGYRLTTVSLSHKLGMTLKSGGHIFEEILDPDRELPSGKTIWEEYPHWFGLPEGGIKEKNTALKTQFCVSQGNLIEYLGQALIHYLINKWREADRIDLWGFDTWGSTCTCSDCFKRGNSTDQMLYFMSCMRKVVDDSVNQGILNHNVQLIMCGYEGTGTISGPDHPFPDNLLAAGDYIVFYPINRCYSHDFSDAGCSQNGRYRHELKGWFNHSESMPVIIGEYYNVSKFEDLPLLFTTRIVNDLPTYYGIGVRGVTYMHVPMVNWAMRTLTQLLYAQLSWDINTDVKAFIDEYFAARYGPYQESLRNAYNKMEQAWFGISEWRAWKADSILSLLLCWDGKKPQHLVPVNDHIISLENIAADGERSLSLMREALALINEARSEDWIRVARLGGHNRTIAVNPFGARGETLDNLYEMRLGEDRRLLIYGIDTMRIMVSFVKYYNALYHDDMAVEATWKAIEEVAEKLDSYYLPISYSYPGVGLESKDAQTRSQFREIIGRCRNRSAPNVP